MAIFSSADLYAAARVDRVEQAIVQMEQNGFLLDTTFCHNTAARAMEDEAASLQKLFDWAGQLGIKLVDDFNWASSQQVLNLFENVLKIPPSPVWKKGRVNLAKGERKLDEAALDWMRGRVDVSMRGGIDELIHLRRIRGAIKYLTKLPGFVGPDGMVHPVSGPASDQDQRAGTITWRLACKNPEVMQIPTDPKKDWYRIRKAFIVPEGHKLIVADEKALEVVVLAHLLIRLFDDHQLADMVAPGAPDIHAVNARMVFGRYLGWTRHGRKVDEFPLECFKDDSYPELVQLRQDIKAVWYGLMYGKSAYGFATSLRDDKDEPIGEKAAQAIVDAIFAAVPGVPRYQNFIADYVVQHHGVPGLGGAWCDLSELTKSGDKWDLKRAIRVAQNYPMQEGGARIIGRAMVDITDDPFLWNAGLRIERQVHDEFDMRIPESAPISSVTERISYHMTSYGLDSALQVSIGVGTNWDNA